VAYNDHPGAVVGGLLASPIGGFAASYAFRTEECAIAVSFCWDELNTGAGIVVTLIGWGLTALFAS
jgi:hypothetical protein